MREARIVVGVDTGGTFTDFIFIHDGKVSVAKRPSRPSDPVSVIREGIVRFARGLAGKDGAGASDDRLMEKLGPRLVIVHGTTVPTNALLEGKTARVCLITNKGFEDVVEIGRQERSSLFRLPVEKAAAPVPRGFRFGVAQRTLYDGSEAVGLTAREVAAAAGRAARCGARAAAVCLLYSFLDPKPEERLGRACAAAGLAVSLSSRVAPEFREYERTTTTVINASLQPVVDRYFRAMMQAFPGAEVLIMTSAGSVVPPEETAERPVKAILSGPAGGVAGSSALLEARASLATRSLEARAPGRAARLAALPPLAPRRAITFDMGGTSTDVALVEGEPLRRHQSSILGLPLLVPSVDIHTVGAGGGSLIWIDRGGALRVGPESAGADPGPACYGKALAPALTDAHLVLGRLGPFGLLGGDFPIEPERSARALLPLAKRLRVTPAALCRAVLDVADAVVEKAIRVITLGRGRDPRDFPLVAFGGAGGLHACRLMRNMELPAVIVPPNPGALSAAGIAFADLGEERALGLLLPLTGRFAGKLAAGFARMEADWRRERAPRGAVTVVKEIDLRYRGQSFQLTLPFAPARTLRARFHAAHRDQYGHADEGAEVEAVVIRARFMRRKRGGALRLFGAAVPAPATRRPAPADRRPAPAALARPLPGFGRKPVPVYRRESLEPGQRVFGPAVISEYSATTFVEAGCAAAVDATASLVITAEPLPRAPARTDRR